MLNDIRTAAKQRYVGQNFNMLEEFHGIDHCCETVEKWHVLLFTYHYLISFNITYGHFPSLAQLLSPPMTSNPSTKLPSQKC